MGVVTVEMRQIHAPLQFAQILHACHDFLPRIAAFLEIHAADEIEIHHLRDELLLCLRQDHGNAGTNVEPVPTTAADGLRVTAEYFPQSWSVLCRGVDLQACITDTQHAVYQNIRSG